MSALPTYIPLDELISWWPDHLFSNPGLGSVGITRYKLVQSAGSATASLSLAVGSELVITLAGLEDLALVLPTADLEVEADYTGDFEIRAGGFTASLRITSPALIPVSGSFPDWILQLDESGNPEPVELSLNVGQLIVDADFSPYFEITNELALSPLMIGNTGIVVVVNGARLYLSGKETPPAGQPAGFRGLSLDQVSVYLPDSFDLPGIIPENIQVRSLVIGQGGVSGSFSGEWQTSWDGLTPTGDGAGKLLGLPFALKSIGVSLVQNALTSGVFLGEIGLPFLDTVLAAEVALDSEGAFAISLSGTDSEGLVTVNTPIGTFRLNSLGIVSDDQGTGVLIGGSMQLEVGSPTLQWPEIEIQSLRISPDGDVQIPGGWLDFQQPVALDLFGFRMEISRLGFGSLEDKRRWVGFSGGLHLVDILPAGVSVEGLRVTWDPSGASDPEISLQGVGIELTVPGAVTLAGEVALIQEGNDHFFAGNARLEILPTGISLDASVKIGHNLEPEYTYVYTYLGLQLPIGIPLWATGAALYGISGLYGLNVEPGVTGNDWYTWYTGTPRFDVTAASKWDGAADGRAFGAGLVLGTLFDTGRVISTKALFALVLPGPVVLFDGKANILAGLPELNSTSSEAVFDMLAVLDAQAGFLQINLEAGWSLSQVIDISASAEAYFDFANLRNWHLYLGQDQPEERRIRAYVVALFHADAYLMIDSRGILTGCGVSWGQDWKFGPVKAVLKSWIEAGAGITWRPPQLEGSFGLGGEFEVSVAGFGVGLGIEAILSGKAPALYWVLGQLILKVKLPTPLKDLEEDITLEWKQDRDPLPEDPFASIGLEHLKVDETWMLPDYNETLNPAHPLDPQDEDFLAGPVVPLDARPAIVFNRSMKDVTTTLDLTSPNVYAGGTRIGEFTFDYEVKDIHLEKWSKAGGSAWEAVENLYGAWMAIEDGNGEPSATKLQIWANSPFEFTRQSARTYRDAFLAQHLTWPCAQVPDRTVRCIDWELEALDTSYGPVAEWQGLVFIFETRGTVVGIGPAVNACQTEKALQMSDNETVWVLFPEPARKVSLCLFGQYRSASAFASGELLERIDQPDGWITFDHASIDAIRLRRSDNMFLARVCYEPEAAVELAETTQEHLDRLVAGLEHWSSQDEILEPEMWYRLTVELETVQTHQGDVTRTPYTHYAYFQTAGPPGLAPAWALVEASGGEGNTLSQAPYPQGGGLVDASPYVRWPVPAHGASPVYRAYDIGVEFNENYVEQMYGADMAIRLLDANGKPLLDQAGNEIVFENQWAEAPTAELSETEIPYITRLQGCLELPGYSLPADQKLIASTGILLEEDFSGDLEQWTDVDAPDGDPTLNWAVAGGLLRYTGAEPPALGALLVAGEEAWSDYAVEVELSTEGEAVGIVFRYSQPGVESYYRLRLDAAGRRLERVSAGAVAAVLWEDTRAYLPGEAGVLAVQCQGDRLRGQVGAELLFDLRDGEALLAGKVGIYTDATAAFERFLVREWPAGVLAPQALYSAELLASFVLYQGGLASGWIDAQASWSEWTQGSSHLAAVGRTAWDNYRLEVNVTGRTNQVGVLARFQVDGDIFSCYRLLLNPEKETLRLARLDGSLSGGTYELEEDDKSLLWCCEGASCGVDFGLDEYSLALTCDGDTLVVELNGQEMARVEDNQPLLEGQAGLYISGDGSSSFSDLVIRSAPRQPVYRWSFTTSRYPGLVDLMDTWTGSVYPEPVSGLDAQALGDTVQEAWDAMQAADQDLDTARQALAAAGPEELAACRTAAQGAAAARNETAARYFEALYVLFFGSGYRPAPPVVEISELMEGSQRQALLFESPEPLDWTRLDAGVSRMDRSLDPFADLANVLTVWNEDGTRALFLRTGGALWRTGEYRLHFSYQLDLGAEAPVLRRSGSTLPESAELIFSLASMNRGGR